MELKEVFELVLNFIRNLQKKDKEAASKQAAKDRLKLVLMQDRASVSPDFFELMKKEIIDVIKKYIEIDEESLEVQLTRGVEAGLEGPALYANIPIKNVKPVAPQNEDEQIDVPELEMTEEKAEKIAEQLLNQIEEVAVNEKNKEEIVAKDLEKDTSKELAEEEKKVTEKEDAKKNEDTSLEENKKPKEEKKKATTRKTTKTTTKKASVSTKKTTTKSKK